jgi:hypothetical protein
VTITSLENGLRRVAPIVARVGPVGPGTYTVTVKADITDNGADIHQADVLAWGPLA